MNENVERLARLLPPPVEDVSAPPWGQSRTDVGFDFPSDYRAFVDLYGGGHIEGSNSFEMFDIYAPCVVPRRRGEPGGFEGFVAWHASEFASMFEDADEDFWGGTKYAMYPASGGLLTWGENEQGDLFWWLTEGDDPDAWPVIMWARGPATTYRFDVGMVGFLHSMASRKAPSPEWLHMTGARWTMTSDWLRRGLDVSIDPES